MDPAQDGQNLNQNNNLGQPTVGSALPSQPPANQVDPPPLDPTGTTPPPTPPAQPPEVANPGSDAAFPAQTPAPQPLPTPTSVVGGDVPQQQPVVAAEPTVNNVNNMPEPQPLAPQPAGASGPISPPTAQQPPMQPAVSGVGVPTQPLGTPITPSAAQPQPIDGLSASSLSKIKAKKKTIILAAIAVFVIVLLGVGGWFVYSSFFNKIPLKTYQGDGFSVLVPRDYKKTSKDGYGFVDFEERTDDKDSQSGEAIGSSQLPDSYRDEAIKSLDKEYKDSDGLKASIEKDAKIKDYKFEKIKHNGDDARMISATAMKDNKKFASVRYLIVFGDKKAYFVATVANVSDPEFDRATGDILSSFKLD